MLFSLGIWPVTEIQLTQVDYCISHTHYILCVPLISGNWPYVPSLKELNKPESDAGGSWETEALPI